MAKNRKMLNKICLFILFSVGYANLLMPAMILESRLRALPIIILSFVIEAIIISLILDVKWKRGILYSILANVASLIVGIPFRAIIVTLNAGMFGSIFVSEYMKMFSALIVVMIITVINSIIEFAVLSVVFFCWRNKNEKEKDFYEKLFYAMLVGNFITVFLAIFW